MADSKTIVNVATGEVDIQPLTDAEIADRDAANLAAEQAAADAPPSPEERIAALEARLEAVAAKADEASVTAQEVAAAARQSKS